MSGWRAARPGPARQGWQVWQVWGLGVAIVVAAGPFPGHAVVQVVGVQRGLDLRVPRVEGVAGVGLRLNPGDL
eukprot:355584-Chlamydomonas_euryale.AAC.2